MLAERKRWRCPLCVPAGTVIVGAPLIGNSYCGCDGERCCSKQIGIASSREGIASCSFSEARIPTEEVLSAMSVTVSRTAATTSIPSLLRRYLPPPQTPVAAGPEGCRRTVGEPALASMNVPRIASDVNYSQYASTKANRGRPRHVPNAPSLAGTPRKKEEHQPPWSVASRRAGGLFLRQNEPRLGPKGGRMP
jgi:hypothetical protein